MVDIVRVFIVGVEIEGGYREEHRRQKGVK